jgi:para-aminobenzoate synthetase component 1
MIRYIEKQNDTFFYRSGGGITTQSSVEQEYQEVKDKVYLPIG